MLYARKRESDGRLSDIWEREPTHPDDVPLDAMPAGRGPFVYDAANRLAVLNVAEASRAASEARRDRAEEVQGRIDRLVALRARAVALGKATDWIDARIVLLRGARDVALEDA